MHDGPTRKTRSDAAQNRAHLLDVARTAFGSRGLAVTMREIARRAGLGVATVYRHFPTHDALVAAAFADQVAACTATANRALGEVVAWNGLCMVVEEFGRHQASDRGFMDALFACGGFTEERSAGARALDELVRRAHAQGSLRADAAASDVRQALVALRGVYAPTPERALVETRRLSALLLQGLRAVPSSPPAPLPLRHSG